MDPTTIPTSSETKPGTEFRLRRWEKVTTAVRNLFKGPLFLYHRFVVEGGENLPRSGTALILPKHRAYRDIVVEGVLLHRLTSRHASYVMKVGLYGILEVLGGVKIVRPRDIRRIEDRDVRRQRIEWARDRNQHTLDYLAWLYTTGELVVSHPEGTRCADNMGVLQKQVIEHMISVEREGGLRVPMIPVGLEYENIMAPRSAVFFRVGAPIYSDEFADVGELMAELQTRIGDLSFRFEGSQRGTEVKKG